MRRSPAADSWGGDLRDWMQAERDTMSKHNPVAKAIA